MHETPQTRQSLLMRLRGGRDERAWSEFLSLYEPLILRLMRRRGLQENDARDMTQQVMLQISGAIERFQPDGAEASFRRWLYRIARNVFLTFLSRQSRLPQLVDDVQNIDAFEITSANSLEASLFDVEYRQQVLAWALEQVRREFQNTSWQAFVESAVHDRPIATVARELNMSTGSVYVARSRIIARLRAKVKEFEAEQ